VVSRIETLKFSFILPTVINVTPTVARVNLTKISNPGKNHHVTLTNSIPANRLIRGEYVEVRSIGLLPLAFTALVQPLNAELHPICHLLALLGAHHILHVSRIRAAKCMLRL